MFLKLFFFSPPLLRWRLIRRIRLDDDDEHDEEWTTPGHPVLELGANGLVPDGGLAGWLGRMDMLLYRCCVFPALPLVTGTKWLVIVVVAHRRS